MASSVRKSSRTSAPPARALALARALEGSSNSIISFDKEWRFTFLNSRATAELHPTEDLIGTRLLDVYPQIAQTPFWPAYQDVMSTRELRHVEGFMPVFDRWYEAYIAPDDDGGITVFFRNIDARKRGEEALRESAAQLNKTLDHLPQMVWSARPDGTPDYYNRLWYDFTGMPEGSTDDDAWSAMFHPDDQERAWSAWRHSLETGERYELEYRLRHRSGEYRWVLGRAWPERDDSGAIVRWYGTCTDIHGQVCAQEALRESQVLKRSVLEASPDCIKFLSVDGTLEFMNGPGWKALELDSFAQVQGKSWLDLWPAASRKAARAAVAEARAGRVARFTGYCPTAKGTPKWWDVVISPMRDHAGTITRLLSISRDVTTLRTTSDQLQWASEHDSLTSLPNRRSFQAHLQAAILRAMRNGSSVGLLLMDLDHFKHVNDTLGHIAGDHVLQTFAERLRAATRKHEFVARLGGDEFAVVLEEVEAQNLVEAGESILARLKVPVRFEGRVISGGASIGGALFPQDADTAHELLKNADTALYALKDTGRGGTRMFHKHMRAEAQRVASQLSLARIAITDRNVIPHYQPKVDIKTGEVVGFEALLRWRHPRLGMQEPDTVLEAFKDYELASKIGELMQLKVLADIADWRRRGMDVGHISINAAPAEFLRDDYAEKLLCRLDHFDVPPSMIEVEVTEHAFLDRGSAFVGRALGELKRAGVTISLDDFGTGHSSLSHLRDFPVDVVKIDRSFVEQMITDPEIGAIVRAVIDLARCLSIKVVAEGVETADQRDLLKVMGCDLGQGWYFGKPAQHEQASGFVAKAA